MILCGVREVASPPTERERERNGCSWRAAQTDARAIRWTAREEGTKTVAVWRPQCQSSPTLHPVKTYRCISPLYVLRSTRHTVTERNNQRLKMFKVSSPLLLLLLWCFVLFCRAEDNMAELSRQVAETNKALEELLASKLRDVHYATVIGELRAEIDALR